MRMPNLQETSDQFKQWIRSIDGWTSIKPLYAGTRSTTYEVTCHSGASAALLDTSGTIRPSYVRDAVETVMQTEAIADEVPTEMPSEPLAEAA